eukprot:PhF_6_TR8459/c0_g1_i1/m.13209/K08959/CSNK1D; casein kinase 1, delta
MGRDITSNRNVSIKTQKTAKHSQLHKEYVVYKEIQRAFPTRVGYPEVFYYGIEGEYEVLVMELLGPSIEDLFLMCNRVLSSKCVLSLGIQLLAALEMVHSLGFVHRDLKPSNCVMGMGPSCHYVHLIDFGLCSRYRRSRGEHIELREDRPFVGTTRFCSLNVHLGLEASRRDDMESLGYVLVYLYLGSLPWQHIKSSTKEVMRRLVMESKVSSVDAMLPELPAPLAEFVSSSRRASFVATPEYARWRELFQSAIHAPFSEITYDWEEGFTLHSAMSKSQGGSGDEDSDSKNKYGEEKSK